MRCLWQHKEPYMGTCSNLAHILDSLQIPQKTCLGPHPVRCFCCHSDMGQFAVCCNIWRCIYSCLLRVQTMHEAKNMRAVTWCSSKKPEHHIGDIRETTFTNGSGSHRPTVCSFVFLHIHRLWLDQSVYPFNTQNMTTVVYPMAWSLEAKGQECKTTVSLTRLDAS